MRRIISALAVVLLAGCGGGGSSGNSSLRTTQQMGTAVLTLAYTPSGGSNQSSTASSSRHVLYIDPATQSVGVSINGSAAQIINVGSSSPNCTTSNSVVTCTVDLSAPYGNDTFAISLYSGPKGTGAVIGVATATGDVSANGPFSIDATVSANYSVYVPARASGIQIYNETGALQGTLPIASTQVSLDDAGNIYNIYIAPTPAPSGTFPPGILKKYPAGATTASATYLPSLSNPQIIGASGTGVLAVLSENSTASTFNLDVWNPGVSGAPSFTIPLSSELLVFFFSIRHDGTIYVADTSGPSLVYNVYAPGSTTPTSTITDTIVSAANVANFAPNYMTVGPDGTLYVTEYTFVSPDPLAGLYIYPPSGPERFVATTSDGNGAGPEGVDTDAAGNLYLANNNAAILGSTCVAGPPPTCQLQNDSLHDVTVYAPGASSVLRHITANIDPYNITTSPDGTVFVSGYPLTAFGTQTVAQEGSYIIPPGGSTPVQFTTNASTVLALYDGYEEHAAANHRHSTSYSSLNAAAHNGAASLLQALQLSHRLPLARH